MAKMKRNGVSSLHQSCPPNPWINVTWANTVATCDKGVITPAYCSAKGIDIGTLPEPYSGILNSRIVFLNLNPGPADKCFHGYADFLIATQNTLNHAATEPTLWDTPLIKNGKLHDGCTWWQDRTKELREAICPKALNVFRLEFFPYHTNIAFNFPNLPSNAYRNYLLCQAMKEGKLIVVLRGKTRWFGISDKCCDGEKVGEKLASYPNLIIHRNPRSVYLTSKNFDTADWKIIVDTLKD